MDSHDERVRQQALQHLARVLGVEKESLEQAPLPDSELARRQLDTMQRELEAVADAQLLREMTAGTLLIWVGTYCAQMVRCSRIDPARVARVIGETPAH